MNSRRARIATLVTAAGVATQTRQRRRKSVSPSLSEVAADYKWLHVEARYNYEALDTGCASAWPPRERGRTIWTWKSSAGRFSASRTNASASQPTSSTPPTFVLALNARF
jgi:hypothetical protein